MKWIVLLSLFSFIGCQVDTGRSDYNYHVEKIKVPEVPEIVVPKIIIEKKTLEPTIVVNEDLKEFEITNDAGEFCGIELNKGEIVPYQFATNDLLQLDLNGKTMNLVRENSNNNPSPEPVMFGKWNAAFNNEDGLSTLTVEIKSADKITVNISCMKKS